MCMEDVRERPTPPRPTPRPKGDSGFGLHALTARREESEARCKERKGREGKGVAV
jgi:hypothetical protein